MKKAKKLNPSLQDKLEAKQIEYVVQAQADEAKKEIMIQRQLKRGVII